MAKEMTETQMVGLVRNALLVAGQEMGQSGDHWPVIKDTIHSIARDWDEARLQREVDAEMRIHLYEQLGIMEAELVNCTANVCAELKPQLQELRDICDSYFETLDANSSQPVRDEEIPIYVKRAEAIIATLRGIDE